MRGTIPNLVRSNTETFPSQTELSIAKALLLLSSQPSISIKFLAPASSSTSRFAGKSIGNEDSSPTESRSGSSTITSAGARVAQADLLRVLAVAAHLQDAKLKMKSGSEDSPPSDSKSSSTVSSGASCVAGNLEVAAIRPHEMKFKVIRKARSKHYRNPNSRRRDRLCFTKSVSSSSVGEEEKNEVSSDVSNASSAVLALPSQDPATRRRKSNKSPEPKRQTAVSATPYLKRRADVILKFLSERGSASEIRIREVIGNSPDTSKALRMLLKLEKIRRCGAGGQRDPFIYMVAESDSTVDSS